MILSFGDVNGTSVLRRRLYEINWGGGGGGEEVLSVLVINWRWFGFCMNACILKNMYTVFLVFCIEYTKVRCQTRRKKIFTFDQLLNFKLSVEPIFIIHKIS